MAAGTDASLSAWARPAQNNASGGREWFTMIQARAELKRGRMGKRKVRPDGDEKKEARGKAEGGKKICRRCLLPLI